MLWITCTVQQSAASNSKTMHAYMLVYSILTCLHKHAYICCLTEEKDKKMFWLKYTGNQTKKVKTNCILLWQKNILFLRAQTCHLLLKDESATSVGFILENEGAIITINSWDTTTSTGVCMEGVFWRGTWGDVVFYIRYLNQGRRFFPQSWDGWRITCVFRRLWIKVSKHEVLYYH